jgi:hypothetical protein
MPVARRSRPIRDFSLYRQSALPGLDEDRNFTHEPMQDDHICVRDKPQVYRDVLCFSVPCSVLEPNASTYAAYNIQDKMACLHSHALAFFFYALYAVTQLDKCDAHVYVEAVVRNPLALPVLSKRNCKGHYTPEKYKTLDATQIASERAAVTARNNLVGYRVWVLLMANCYGIEIVLRRALFRCQVPIYLSTVQCAEYKLRYCIIPDADERRAAIRVDAEAEVEEEENKKGGARKRGRGIGLLAGLAAAPAVAGDNDGGGGDAEAGADRERKIKRQIEKIEKQVCNPAPQAARASAKIYSGEVGSQFISIYSMETYIDSFVLPLRALAGLAMPSADDTADALRDIAGVWGETKRFDQMGPPLCTEFNARNLLSFNYSVCTLSARCDKDFGPCDDQNSADMYGLTESTLRFPLPALVWSIGAQRLAPDTLMRHALPWHIERFEEELRRLRSDVDSQARARMREARTLCSQQETMPSIERMITNNAIAPRKRATSEFSVDVDVIRAYEEAALGGVQEMRDDNYDEPAAPIRSCEEQHALLRELTAVLSGDDPLQLSLKEHDTRTVTEHISSDVTLLCDEFSASWEETVRLVSELERPPTVQPCEEKGWRAEKLRALNALRVEDHMSRLLQTLNSSPLVSESHLAAYRMLTVKPSVEYMVRPALSIAPHMTVVANAIIMPMTHISFLNLQHGEVEMLEMNIVMVMQAAMPKLENAYHRVLIGAPATAKSLGADRACQEALPGTINRRDVVTGRAEYTANLGSNMVQLYDEANSSLTDHRPEAIARNPEYPRTKQQMSTRYREFERCVRNEETGEMRNHRARVENVSVRQFHTNQVHFGGWERMRADAALVSRVNFLMFAPWKPAHGAAIMRSADVLTDLHSAQLEKVWNSLALRHQEETAFKIMLVLMSTTHVCASFNTDCVDIIQRAAFEDLERWVPKMVTKMREAARARFYGITTAYSTVCYALLISEASPLVEWVPDPSNPGRYVCVPLKFTLNDLPKLFAPHMYTRIEHGLWSTFNLVYTQYQFLFYIILLEIAARERGFRRTWMAPVYRNNSVELIDDTLAQRWRERGSTTLAYPEFLQYLLEQEQLLDNLVVANANNNKLVPPQFARITAAKVQRIDTLSQDEALAYLSDAIQGASRAQARSSISNTDRATTAAREYEQAALIDPNWLDIGMDENDLSVKATRYIALRVRMDEAQVLTALDDIAALITVRVPVLANIQLPVTQHAIKPADLNFVRDTTVTNGTNVRYEEVPLLKVQRNATLNRRTVRISTCALMIPPQMLACLALTAFENHYTKPRETVLLSEVPHHSAFCVPWQVKQREGRILTVNTVREPGLFTQQCLSRAALTQDALSVHVATHITSLEGAMRIDKDIEEVAFERHMRELQQIPALHEVLKTLFDQQFFVEEVCAIRCSYAARHPTWQSDEPMLYPTIEEVESAFTLWLRGHPARPFALEDRRGKLQQEISAFAPISTVSSPHSCYPRTHIVSAEVTHAFNKLVHRAVALPYTYTTIENTLRSEVELAQCCKNTLCELNARYSLTPDAVELKEQINAANEQLYRVEVGIKYTKLLEQVMSVRADRPEVRACPENDADRVACQANYDAQYALELLLCIEPWFSGYTTKLYDMPEWRPVLSAAVAAVAHTSERWIECTRYTLITECPRDAYVPSDNDKETIRTHIGAVPGLVVSGSEPVQFSLHALRWLERSLAFEELLNDLVLIYATHSSVPRNLAVCVPLLGKDEMSVTQRIADANMCIEEAKINYVETRDEASFLMLRRREDSELLARRMTAMYYTEQCQYWKQLGVVDAAWRNTARQISALSTTAGVVVPPSDLRTTNSAAASVDILAALDARSNALREQHIRASSLSAGLIKTKIRSH